MTSRLVAGTRVGHYEIVGLLGAGGMGDVYRATDSRLNREVALKVLPSGVAADESRLRRFRLEARATAALAHPNILAIYDVGEEQGHAFLVCELLEGSTLRSRLEAGPLPPRKVIEIGRQVAAGLAAAHSKGIVHRDIKPENIFLLPDGRVKILDFGLAKVMPMQGAEGVSTETAPDVTPGTIAYMSPEHLHGLQVDGRSDIFSLGSVLYEMVAGRHAFKTESAARTLAAILTSDPPALPALGLGTTAAFEAVVRRCLEKSPAERFQSAGDLALALDAVGSGLDHLPSTLRWRPPLRMFGTFTGRQVVAGAVTAILVLLPAGGLLLRRVPAARPPESAAVGLGRAGENRSAESRRRVIVVLPFRSLSRDGKQDYLAAGIAEEIHGQLSKVAALRVLSHSSIGSPNLDLRRIGAELGAGSAVEGTVRTDRGRLRVTVELVDTASLQTIWSDEYDRRTEDIFEVQSDVAVRVAAALHTQLSPEEWRRVARRPTSSVAAFDLYLGAKLPAYDGTKNAQAIDLLRKALRIDPQFAEAWVGLAYRLYWLSGYGGRHNLDLAFDAARHAVASDPDLASAHSVLASIYGEMGRVNDARVSYLRSLELDPNEDASLFNLSMLEWQLGRYDEALMWAVRGFRATTQGGYFDVAVPLLSLGEDAACERWLQESERRSPAVVRSELLWAYLDARRGQLPTALARARTVIRADPDNEEALVVLSELAYAGGDAEALDIAERVYRRSAGFGTLSWIFVESPRLRYAFLLDRHGDRTRSRRLAAEALAAAERSLATGDELPRVPLEISAVHAIRGEAAEALNWLERAYAAGLRDHWALAIDPVFDGVRREPRFSALLAQMQAGVAAMRARANVAETLPVLPSVESRRQPTLDRPDGGR